MADILNVTGSNYTSGSIERGESSVQLNTGALRRKYNFGDKVSELALAQDPFFRFVSMVSKKPTDDPSFKFTEKRSSYTKRYAYMSDFSTAGIAVPATAPATTGTPAAGNNYSMSFFCDYNNDGNHQNEELIQSGINITSFGLDQHDELLICANTNIYKLTSDEEVGIMGDLNQDGLINVQDIILSINIILGATPSDYQLWSGDLNQDGVIDILDIVLLINLILIS